ncbi:MAG: dipeptidyl-peptidase 3 family protein [Bacteroidota bacterium]
MNKYLLLLITIIMVVPSCQRNLEFLNKNFYGSETTAQIQQITDADELSIRFEPSRVFINGTPYSYDISEFNDNYYLIKVEIEDESVPDIIFRYEKEDGDLILLAENPDNSVMLMTQDKVFKNELQKFNEATLTSDISHLSDNQKRMLVLLFEAADYMNDIFWMQSYGDKEQLMETTDNEDLKDLFRIHYGPWNRLSNNKPFLPRYGEKYPGANFYPSDMTVEEFNAFENPDKTSQYTLIRRDDQGNLKSVWYHEAYSEKVNRVSELLKEAAGYAKDDGFREYLEKRAEALLTDEYYESDVAWMKMKNNDIDFIIGPIENYEDQLFNYKAAHESFILIKDHEWSEKISRLAELLPLLQKELPVPEKFKQETPGTSSDLNVYDAVYYAGDCNAGSKTIAINLPNDPEVRKNYGSRKLQLKNSIRYKFENILVLISNVLIAEEQRQYVKFNAFFENTLFHEVAHGLGVDYTINGKGPVRQALKEAYSPIEEGKADILGLYIVTKLAGMGELDDTELMDNYVTFMASIFRSIRFGASSAHGKANMIRFNYFKEKGAFSRNEDGNYSIDFEKMKSAMEDLSLEIITIQGTGDYEKATQMIEEKGYIGEELLNDLQKLNALNIPVDLVFQQGVDYVGL